MQQTSGKDKRKKGKKPIWKLQKHLTIMTEKREVDQGRHNFP
jgi:hypothetical protein